MANLTAFKAIDMRVLDTLVDIEVTEPDRVVVTDGPLALDYRGDFGFAGGTWSGRIDRVTLSDGPSAVWQATGLDLPARFVRPGADGRAALETALAGSDDIRGSGGGDVLLGYDGADNLFGRGGRDTIKGQAGSDVLEGGLGRDEIFGGGGQDTFVFGPDSGSDRVGDYADGVDTILIAETAIRFRELDIERSGSDTLVRYGDNSILLAGVSPGELDRGDFLFTA